MLTGKGYIRRGGTGPVEVAFIRETRNGVEYAELPAEGIILLPTAYEWEGVHTLDSDEDELDLDKILADINAAP